MVQPSVPGKWKRIWFQRNELFDGLVLHRSCHRLFSIKIKRTIFSRSKKVPGRKTELEAWELFFRARSSPKRFRALKRVASSSATKKISNSIFSALKQTWVSSEASKVHQSVFAPLFVALYFTRTQIEVFAKLFPQKFWPKYRVTWAATFSSI